MKRKLKIILLLAAIFLCLKIYSANIYAEEALPEMPEGYENIKDYIPDDIFSFLPDGIFSDSTEEINESLNKITKFDYILSVLAQILNLELKESINLLFILSSSIIFCALINSLNSDTLQASGNEMSRFISNILIISVLLSQGTDIISCSKIFFERLNIFMTGMLPFMCTLSAMGGGISSAVAANYGISAFLSISELALSQSVTPIASACISLASVGVIGENSAGSSLLKWLKRVYIFMIGMLMTLMLFVFSARGIMANSADSLGGRAIKFAAGNFIPIVGSNIGDILKGVGSGISYLKNTVGVVSVFIILLMLLPTFITLLIRRFVLFLCASLCDLLGASEQGKVINEFASVYGMIIAVISMSSVLFIAAVIISVRIGNAVM